MFEKIKAWAILKLQGPKQSAGFEAMSVMPDPGPVALRAIAEAENKNVLAVREVGGNNRGKHVEIYLKSVNLGPGQPWCMAFVYYRILKAAELLGVKLPAGFPRTGYTPTGANYFKQRNLWIPVSAVKAKKAKPQRGDLVFFYFSTKGRIAHVGIVSSVTANGVYTIEGNTTSGRSSSGAVVRDGGGVYKTFRTWAEIGSQGGFGRLVF